MCIRNKNQFCVNCHFLVKITWYSKKEKLKISLRDQERLNIKNKNFSFINNDKEWHLACYFDVWNETSGGGLANNRFENLCKKNRKYFCFFWKHRPEMLLSAAEILQKRDYENTKLARNYKLTRWGLYIAGAGLIINSLISLITKRREVLCFLNYWF